MNLGTRLAQAVVDHDRKLVRDGRREAEEAIVPSTIWRQFLDLAEAELRRRKRAQAISRAQLGTIPTPEGG